MAVIARKIRKPLAHFLEGEAGRMKKLYRDFGVRVDSKLNPLRKLVEDGDKEGFTLRYLQRVQKQVQEQIRQLEKDVLRWEQESFPGMYMSGREDAILDLKEARRVDVRFHGGTGTFHQESMRLLADELYGKVNIKATVGRRYKDQFRKLGLQNAIGIAGGVDTWQQGMTKLLDDFREMNIEKFEDARGRLWHLRDYAEMVSRTVTMHVMNVGQVNRNTPKALIVHSMFILAYL